MGYQVNLGKLAADVKNYTQQLMGLTGQTVAYNVKTPPYNAKGNGSAEDTAAVQACMNDCASSGIGYVTVPAGTFMIDAVKSLNIPSNIRIVLNAQTVFKAIANNSTTYSIFKISNASNVFIEGNGALLLGDRATHTVAPAWQANHVYALNDQVNANGIVLKCTTPGTSSATMPTGQGTAVNDGTVVWAYVYSGEGGMGVNIVNGSTNIFISDLTAKNCWGDGFYVGGGINCENVHLTNCIGDANRRQGLSITNVKNMFVTSGEYKNTIGTNPQYGIDVEPNNNCVIQNVNLTGVSTSNNFGGGLQLCPMFMTGTNAYSVNVAGFTSESDLGGGIDLIGGSPFPTSEVYGKINIKDAVVINPVSTGVYFQAWRNMPRADVSNVTVINPNAQNSSNLQLSSGFVVYASPNDAAGNYGNIKFENCGVIDNRTTSQTYAPFYMASDATHTIQNVSIIDPYWEGIKPTLKGWIDSTGNFFGNAKFTNASVVNISSSQLIYAYLGQELVATSSLTATLASSNGSVGNEYTLRYGATSGTVVLAAGSGDTIIYKGSAVASVSLTVPGTFIKVRSIGGNKWIVVEQNIA